MTADRVSDAGTATDTDKHNHRCRCSHVRVNAAAQTRITDTHTQRERERLSHKHAYTQEPERTERKADLDESSPDLEELLRRGRLGVLAVELAQRVERRYRVLVQRLQLPEFLSRNQNDQNMRDKETEREKEKELAFLASSRKSVMTFLKRSVSSTTSTYSRVRCQTE
jgi:hypothetical protein